MAKKKANTEDKEVIKKLDHDLEEELAHKDEAGGKGFNDPSLLADKKSAPKPQPEEGVSKPTLKGTNKPKPAFEQAGTDNQLLRDIGLESEQ